MVKAKKAEDHSGPISGETDQASLSDDLNPNSPAAVENHESNAEQAPVHQIFSACEFPASEIIRTLPHGFNGMIGESIDIETDHARELIGILGEKLGIEDYQTNIATFWLLDTIALEIIRNKERLNPVNLGMMVSWIAGEAKLIQEKKFTRAEFFREMNFIFETVSGRLDEGRRMMYWEEVAEICSPTPKKGQQGSEEDEEELVLGSASETIRPTVSDRLKMQKNFEDAAGTFPSNLMTDFRQNYPAADVLEAIMESTYSVYANAFHYAIISAAFAQPVEIHSYQLPYTLRLPRPVKPPVSPPVTTETRGKAKSKTDKGNPGKSKGKEKARSKSPSEIPPSPPLMTDEEMMDQKRRYILPLMESNEAVYLLGQFTQPRSIGSTEETGVKKKATKKGKRKA